MVRVFSTRKRIRKYYYLTLLLIAGIVGIPYALTHASPSITTQPWTGVPLGVMTYAHGDGSITTFRDVPGCSNNDPDTALSVVTRTADGLTDYSTPNKVAGWKTGNCPQQRVVGKDGTTYFVQTYSSGGTRLIAKLNGVTLWTHTIPNGACNYAARVFDLALGYDGNLYASIGYSACNAPDVLKLVSFSAAAGVIRFATALPNPTSLINVGMSGREVMPYNGGIAFANNGPNVYYYDYNGVIDASKTFSPSIPSNSTIVTTGVSDTGRVYLAINTSTARRIFYKDTTSSTISEITPSVGGDYIIEIHPAPGDRVVLRWYKNSAPGITYYDSSNAELYSKNLASDGAAYLAYIAHPWIAIDSLGNVITTRTMNKGTERHVYVDSFDPSGNMTRLMDSDAEFGTSTTDNFTTSNFTTQSLGDEALYLPLCHTTGSSSNTYCTSGENPELIRVTMVGSFNYPRSSLFTALDYDNDSDDLTLAQEVAQGTSDTAIDSDSDGLSDFTESVYLPNRDILFCSSTTAYCEYPNPTQRDIYIEADWMVKPGTGGFSMQLNTNQINLVKTAFQNKGIAVHFDTGQLGGGNEVPYSEDISFTSTENLVDFYDYKVGDENIDRQFESERYHIYRYMLFGNVYNSSLVSGVARAGDDDTFIAYGLVNNGATGPSADLAIASVIMHELGHTLCLTNPDDGIPAYAGQPASCRFDGVDEYVGAGYPSAENYSNAFTLADFSTGQAGLLDHDDWNTIRLFDFASSDAGDPVQQLNRSTSSSTNRIDAAVIEGIPVSLLKNKIKR